MSYNKEMSESLDATLDAAAERTEKFGLSAEDAPAAQKIKTLQSLVKALETGMKIVKARHYQAVPADEPFPGGCKAVVEQGLAGIALARKTGLIP
ncbi:hypothetical protein ABIB86_000381 [Bradyrhizobium sp. JR1.7]|uniref:hypothetical protein n=1 Tax=unclassified Bradyrhizobium TaxID=2631580 RepID=UPI003391AB82